LIITSSNPENISMLIENLLKSKDIVQEEEKRISSFTGESAE
jgi:hypothetical protein